MIKFCPSCEAKFQPKENRYRQIFCSVRCANWSWQKREERTCYNCEKVYLKPLAEIRKERKGRSFCSRKCFTKGFASKVPKMIELRKKGYSYEEVGYEFGCAHSTVLRLIRQHKQPLTFRSVK